MTDHAPLLERAFEIEAREAAYRIETIEGEVPSWVRGSYYLNSPGRFQRGEVRYRHWLDGDGFVSTLRFTDKGVDFASRFVKSGKWQAEEEAGKALFRTFGTAFEGDQLVRGIGLASPVNVSIYRFAGHLLAFGEQGLPFSLDPDTLETLGEHTFGRRLNPISPFAAHPNFDPVTGEMLNFGISFSGKRPALNLYRFSAGGDLLQRRRLEIDAPRSVHDFGLSSRYAVFYLSPYVMDMEAFMEVGATLQDALKWRPELGSRLLLAPRDDRQELVEIDLGDRYCLHLISCFEEEGSEGSRSLFVDVLELERPVYDQYSVPQLFTDVRHAHPVRYRVDLASQEVAERTQLDFDHMGDFPVVDPRTAPGDYHRFWYLAISATAQPGRKFFDELVCCDWREGGPTAIFRAPAGCYLCGEPVFLPPSGDGPVDENGGAILCQQFDANTGQGSFLLFDALDVAAGPIATLPLRHPIPLGFHASYYPRPQIEDSAMAFAVEELVA